MFDFCSGEIMILSAHQSTMVELPPSSKHLVLDLVNGSSEEAKILVQQNQKPDEKIIPPNSTQTITITSKVTSLSNIGYVDIEILESGVKLPDNPYEFKKLDENQTASFQWPGMSVINVEIQNRTNEIAEYSMWVCLNYPKYYQLGANGTNEFTKTFIYSGIMGIENITDTPIWYRAYRT